jgi:hypothetical protein
LFRLARVEAEGAPQPAMFVGLEQPAVAAFGDEQLDLFR